MKLLALFGFAKRDVQATIPPIFAYLALVAAAYFAAHVIEAVSWLLGGYAAYLRIPGVVAVALIGHGLYRAVVHRDDNSWAGYVRKILMS